MGGTANHKLRALLVEAGWSPERFARRIAERGRQHGNAVTVHVKTPYHWLRDGRCPHDPVPQLAAAGPSEHLGRTPGPADLGWDQPRPIVRRADDGLAELWLSGGALHGLEEVEIGRAHV